MLVLQALRNCKVEEVDKEIDFLYIEWYQASKRIQRLQTAGGMDIAIRFLGKGQDLLDGDILYEDQQSVVMVSVLPCEAIVLTLADPVTLGLVCFEIGNKHLSLFVEGDSILMPYERPMFQWLAENQYLPKVEKRQLLKQLNANVDFQQHKKFVFTPPKMKLSIKE